MNTVRAKKSLGQHFLINSAIARTIVDALPSQVTEVLEVGAGMGALTDYLALNPSYRLTVVEIDKESVAYLKKKIPALSIVEGDFLRLDLSTVFPESFAVIGNFPYNISSQILFKVLECRGQIPYVVGMFQKEVAERIAARHGSRTYGILSVLLQAFYDIEYLFTVHENAFSPPPKVKSAVIRLQRNKRSHLDCDEMAFVKVVKTAFNQRRKTLRNALTCLVTDKQRLQDALFNRRAEQLSVEEFIELTKRLMPVLR
ncbi:ribosomal RNA small subunit methyltransferase A [Bacteroidia bacterium]|nr:ribosomal RNA small subunit methyltransferase A [Bacteroidia bacterium]